VVKQFLPLVISERGSNQPCFALCEIADLHDRQTTCSSRGSSGANSDAHWPTEALHSDPLPGLHRRACCRCVGRSGPRPPPPTWSIPAAPADQAPTLLFLIIGRRESGRRGCLTSHQVRKPVVTCGFLWRDRSLGAPDVAPENGPLQGPQVPDGEPDTGRSLWRRDVMGP
jgi:hypothetical protein